MQCQSKAGILLNSTRAQTGGKIIQSYIVYNIIAYVVLFLRVLIEQHFSPSNLPFSFRCDVNSHKLIFRKEEFTKF